MTAAGATGEFVYGLIAGHLSADVFKISRIVTYYLLDTDFEALRAKSLSDSETTIFAGLLSEKNIEIATPGDLVCNPIGTLGQWPQDLLRLAICHGRAMFCNSDPAADDRDVFEQNRVDLLNDEDDMIAWIVRRARANRIENHWVLHDGGNQRPRDILGMCCATAREIVIYDRFFRRCTVETIKDLLEFAATQRGAKLDCSVTIYHGEAGSPDEPGYIDYSDMPASLGEFFGNGRMRMRKVVRERGGRHWLHDRFVQIDRSSTFLFTSGVGCFFEGRNPNASNRSCHIYQMRVTPDFEEFVFYTRERGKLRPQSLRT